MSAAPFCSLILLVASSHPASAEERRESTAQSVEEQNRPDLRLRVVWGIGGPAGEAFKSLVAEFNRREPGVVVELVQVGGYGEVSRQFRQGIAAGEARHGLVLPHVV